MDTDIIRLLVRTLELVETRLLPWGKRFVRQCKYQIANLEKKLKEFDIQYRRQCLELRSLEESSKNGMERS